VCRFCDTTAPTKEGLLWDDKIVSNLHDQMSMGRRYLKDSLHWQSAVPVSMVRGISNCRDSLIASTAIATQGDYDVR
jgi:hypothetical protein